MSTWFVLLTVLFIIVSLAMVLIILVQRPQGGGLAGAFGGAGGTGTDTVFGGRVGDALTVMTVIAFVVYLGLAIGLNLMDTQSQSKAGAGPGTDPAAVTPAELPPAGGTAPVSIPIPDGGPISRDPETGAPRINTPSSPPAEPTPDPAPVTDPPAGTGDPGDGGG